MPHDTPYATWSTERKRRHNARAVAWRNAHPEKKRKYQHADAIRRRQDRLAYYRAYYQAHKSVKNHARQEAKLLLHPKPRGPSRWRYRTTKHTSSNHAP